MPELSEYAQKLDSQMLRRTLGMAALLTVEIGALVLFGIVGQFWWLLTLIIIMVLLIAWVMLLMLLPVHPDHLVVPRQLVRGSWSAAIGVSQIPAAVQRHPSWRTSMAQFTGCIEFCNDDTIVWHASRKYSHSYPGADQRWQPPYRLWARRVKGGHRVHVMIQTGLDSEHDVTDIWLNRARRFPI